MVVLVRPHPPVCACVRCVRVCACACLHVCGSRVSKDLCSSLCFSTTRVLEIGLQVLRLKSGHLYQPSQLDGPRFLNFKTWAVTVCLRLVSKPACRQAGIGSVVLPCQLARCWEGMAVPCPSRVPSLLANRRRLHLYAV